MSTQLPKPSRWLIPLFVCALVSAAVLVELSSGEGNAGNLPADAGARLAKTQRASKTSQTAKAVKAANAFKATLTSAQRSTVQFAFNSSAKATGWSNLPTDLTPRNGLAIADMSTAQIKALKKLLHAALSSAGYQQEENTRIADDYLSALQGNGGGGQGLSYGSGRYYVALFGTPSTKSKWMLQFGGHHLAINETFRGKTITGTPYFVGLEPLSFVVASKSYAPMKQKSGAMVSLFNSLSDSQLATAKLSSTFDDVLLGPGHDGEFPTAEGFSVAQMSKAQKALLTKAIRQWVGDMNPAAAKQLMAKYEAGYAKTKIAWATSIDPTVRGAYMRIQGPRVWIEIVTQGGIVTSGVHYHSIWRDRRGDYGG